MGIPDRLLVNRVTLSKRVPVQNVENEWVDTFPDAGDPFPASVQDRAPQQLAIPDIDGPVIVNTTIFTNYRTDIEHLDRLTQTDVSPERVFRVIFVDDAAGRHHHLEVQCERVLVLEEAVS